MMRQRREDLFRTHILLNGITFWLAHKNFAAARRISGAGYVVWAGYGNSADSGLIIGLHVRQTGLEDIFGCRCLFKESDSDEPRACLNRKATLIGRRGCP